MREYSHHLLTAFFLIFSAHFSTLNEAGIDGEHS